jgi:hypothetical protein
VLVGVGGTQAELVGVGGRKGGGLFGGEHKTRCGVIVLARECIKMSLHERAAMHKCTRERALVGARGLKIYSTWGEACKHLLAEFMFCPRARSHVTQVRLGERLTCSSARKREADSGSLLLQIATLCFPRHVTTYILSNSPPLAEGDGRNGGEAQVREALPYARMEEAEENPQRVALVLMLGRTVERLRNVTDLAKQEGVGAAPPGFAHALILLLRRLLALGPDAALLGGGVGTPGVWVGALDKALKQVLWCIGVSRYCGV